MDWILKFMPTTQLKWIRGNKPLIWISKYHSVVPSQYSHFLYSFLNWKYRFFLINIYSFRDLLSNFTPNITGSECTLHTHTNARESTIKHISLTVVKSYNFICHLTIIVFRVLHFHFPLNAWKKDREGMGKE